MNGWKQPIPTNLDQEFGDNKLSKWIYIFILLRARNSNEEKDFAGSLHFLKKGQAVCGMQEIADEFHVNRKTATLALRKLEKVYNKVDIKTTTKGTVVTVRNYDEVVSMGQQTGQQSNNKVTTKGQQSNTNKSDKSEKSVKNNTYVGLAPNVSISDEFKNFMEWYNDQFGKKYGATAKRLAMYKGRRKQFGKSDIFKAFTNLLGSRYHMGMSEDNETFYATPEFLLRSEDQVDKWREVENVTGGSGASRARSNKKNAHLIEFAENYIEGGDS